MRPVSLLFTVLLRSSLLGSTLLGSTLLACGPSQPGQFAQGNFTQSKYKYRVRGDAAGEILPSGWVLDNYYTKKGARGSSLEPKDAGGYTTQYYLDFDGDGQYEKSREEFTFDLKYKHRVHDGAVFLRTIPVSQELQEKKLDTLMDRVIEDLAGAGYDVVVVGRREVVAEEKRYAASVVDRGSAKWAGLPAYGATLEIANLDQIKVDPAARKRRLFLVIAHTDFQYKPSSQVKTTFPVVLIAGYANQPKDFEPSLGEFKDFLARVEIDGRDGFTYTPDVETSSAGDSASPGAPVEATTSAPVSSATLATGEADAAPATEPAPATPTATATPDAQSKSKGQKR